MYQPWQNDPSMESVMKLIEERENREIRSHNYSSRNSEPGNWGIMSLRDVDAPTRSPYQESSTSRGRGEAEGLRRRAPGSPPHARRDEAPLGWRTGRDMAPVARIGLEIASTLTQKFDRRSRSSSSENDRRASRSKHHDTPKKRKSNTERKRRSSRSGSEGRKRSRRSRSNSRSRRGRSGSRGKKRYRSRSRERKRDGSAERSRERTTSQTKQAALTAAVNDNNATSDILSKFMSLIKDAEGKKGELTQIDKVPIKDVLPEFDPDDNANAIVTWVTRVDDIAKLFGWGEKEILQYAMPKLTGLAKVWYLGRKDFIHSWPEWKKKLIEQFPCPNFCEMLKELHQRKCRNTETFENYFHDKLVLVKRCGIRGRQAVDCVLQGIAEEAVRLFATASQYDEPEKLLEYLRTAESIRKKVSTGVAPADATVAPLTKTATNASNKQSKQCNYCNRFGHLDSTCFLRKRAAVKNEAKNVKKCTNCMNYGHDTSTCWNNKLCTVCGKTGHIANVCRDAVNNTNVKPKKMCFVCREVGHLVRRCPNATPEQKEEAIAKRSKGDHKESVCSSSDNSQAPAPASADPGAGPSGDQPPPPGV